MATPIVVAKWRNLAPELLSVLRIVCAFMFMQEGTMKLFGWPMAMPNGMTLTLASQVGVGGILEFVGGLLLLVGLFTRPVAFILAGDGGGVLPVSLPPGVLAARQPGATGGALLLHLALPVIGRPGPLEP